MVPGDKVPRYILAQTYDPSTRPVAILVDEGASPESVHATVEQLKADGFWVVQAPSQTIAGEMTVYAKYWYPTALIQNDFYEPEPKTKHWQQFNKGAYGNKRKKK